MLITAPETIKNVIWEEELKSEDINTTIPKSARFSTSNSNNPKISIGEIAAWKITDYYELDKIPRLWQTMLIQADFYVVQLACSFRPIQNEVRITNALFIVNLLPAKNGNYPIAFDLSPQEINQEIAQECKFTISPNLKFSKVVEANLGSAGLEIKYQELQPIIVATGLQESKPSWEYRQATGRTIEGCKAMYLLLKVPKEMNEVWAEIKLTAELQGRGVGIGRFALWHYDQINPKTSKRIQLI